MCKAGEESNRWRSLSLHCIVNTARKYLRQQEKSPNKNQAPQIQAEKNGNFRYEQLVRSIERYTDQIISFLRDSFAFLLFILRALRKKEN